MYGEHMGWSQFLNAQTLSADYDIDRNLVAWFLYATHRLAMMIISAI